jgi:hypothetical protein
MTSRAERHKNPQPSKPKRSVPEILRALEETLHTVERGLADFLNTGGGLARRAGMRNLVVFGRAVTNVLQNLRTPVGPAFDEWYGPIQEEMENDELLKYFYRLRSDILKQGTASTRGATMEITSLSSSELRVAMGPPPPGALSIFMGDDLGGTGWEVQMPDGTVERYYVELPDHLGVKTTLLLPGGPKTHGGAPLADTSAEALAQHYVRYLQRLVREATERFGGQSMIPTAPQLTVISIAAQVDVTGLLENRTFERTLIQGPAVLLALGGVAVSNSTYSGDAESLFIEVPEGRQVQGVIALRNVTFNWCRFVNVAVMATARQIARWQPQIGFEPPSAASPGVRGSPESGEP